MKKSIFLPVLLLACNPLLASSVVQEQAAACISENGSNLQNLESCLSRLFVPASMDCDELLEVHRSIVGAAMGNSGETMRNATRASSKLAIISLSANCYSPDVAARLVARAGAEMSGSNGPLVADSTVTGAVDAAVALGIDSGSLANSASSSSSPANAVSGGTSASRTTAPSVQIYYDKEVLVSPSAP